MLKKLTKYRFLKVSLDGYTFSIKKLKTNYQSVTFKPIVYKDHFYIIFIRKDPKEFRCNFYKKPTKKFQPKL